MSSLIYFGSSPSSTQTVSRENSSRGINLCRQAPSSLNIIGLKSYTHPSYELYIQYLPKALESARTQTPISFGTGQAYYAYNGKNTPVFTRSPKLVWGYGEKKPSDFLDIQKARFNAIETTAGGKPALSATLSVAQFRDLIRDTSPLETVNPSVNTMNLAGFRVYRKLHALAHAICRLQQYALTASDTKLTNERTSSMVAIPNDSLVAPSGWTTHKVFKQSQSKMQFNMNLPVPYPTYSHVISRAADIPNGEGLIFPYIETLCRDDFETVPSILRGPLNGLFGSDAEENGGVLSSYLETWKTLAITEWGWELTHLFVGIQLALSTGAGIRTYVTPHNVYAGFILTGGLFTVFVDGKSIAPCSFATLQNDFAQASPHSASLTALYELITFPDDIARSRQRSLATSLYDVGVDLRASGYNINSQETIKRLAGKLTFPKDRYLTLNGTNLARVLTCMGTGVGESEIPLHHSALLKTNRNHRLLSAFGAGCPSFIVEGGRKIELTGNFGYKKKTRVQGKTVEVTINTMYAAVKDLEAACDDLDTLMKEKHVLTFAGTPSAGRVSARAMIREFDGNHGTEILAALRHLCGVVVSNDPSKSNQKKRAAEEKLEAETSKKVKAALDDI